MLPPQTAMTVSQSRTGSDRGSRQLGTAPVVALAVGVCYFIGAEMSWRLLGAGKVVVFFPPAGISLAALVLSPRRRWPLLLGVIAAVEVLVDIGHGTALASSLGYALANTIEPLVGAVAFLWLSRRSGEPVVNLDRRLGMGNFLAAAVVLGPIAGALVGATARQLTNSQLDWWNSALHWWAGDSLGVLAFGALVLVVMHRRTAVLRQRPLELAALLVLTVGAGIALFRFWELPLVDLVVVFLLWAALRFGIGGLALTGALVAVVANTATSRGHGPFAALPDTSLQSQVGMSQLFLAVSILTGWFVAVESAERARAERQRRTEHEAREAAERDRAVGALGMALVPAMGPEEVTATVESTVRRYLHADTVVVVRRSRPAVAADRVGAGSVRAALRPAAQEPDGAVSLMVGGRHDVVSAVPDLATLLQDGVRSAALLRTFDDRPLTAVVVGWAEPRDVPEGDRSYLVAIAEVASQALETAELRQAEQLTAARLGALQRITEALVASPTVDEIASVIVEEAVSTMGLRSAELAVRLDAETVLRAVAGTDAARRPLDDAALSGLAAPSRHRAIARRPRLLRTSDTDGWGGLPAFGSLAGAAAEDRWAVVPLSSSAGVTGALLLSADGPHPFSEGDQGFLAAIGDQCSQAIDRVRLRAAEHEAVALLQDSLLKHRLDDSSAFRVEARYYPATSPLSVGGDWYDVHADGGRVMAIVGDVVGSGLPAALAMSQLRSAARALAWRCQPAELLAALDRMAGAVEGALYSTAAVLTIDIESLEVRYAVAGHPPALVRAHDGRVRRLDGGRSAPLGLGIEERPEATTRLAAGDLVVLYTDGLIERRGEGVDAGLDRLSDALAAADPDSDAWCDGLIERSLRGSVQADDVAVLGVQLTLQLDEIAGSAAALTLR